MKTQYTIINKNVFKDGKKIYGELYVPETESFPLIIFSHGLGGNHTGSRDFGEALGSNGIAVYIFDFMGGSYESLSDGKTTEMSVKTEAADLSAVVDELKKDPRITKIFLAGKSQGAFVSTMVAADRPDEIAGLIGLYPGYSLIDAAEEEMKKYEKIPESMDILDLEVGSIYIKDLLESKIYDIMKDYPNDVLLIHGNKDKLVSLESVEKARDSFPKAEMIVLEDAEHGFHGPEREKVIEMVLDFIQKRS